MCVAGLVTLLSVVLLSQPQNPNFSCWRSRFANRLKFDPL